jgi:glycogen synthase
MSAFFNDSEIKTIEKKLQSLKIRHVVFCSFESRFARSGGLAAVTIKILPYLKELKQIENVLLVTPFYPDIMDETKLTPTGITFDVEFNNKRVKVELLKYTVDSDRGYVEEYYLKADGFFETRNSIDDPYGYFPEDPERNEAAARENALFYCKAVPHAVKAVGFNEDIVFHLQEWQTALISLTAKEAMLDGTLVSCGTVQALHNAFDQWMPAETMEKAGIPAAATVGRGFRRHPALRRRGGLTALEMGLQLVDGPVTTVSDRFAEELTEDRLQAEHFAPHLQDIFKKSGVYGVNNGLFIDFPPEYAQKETFTINEIKQIKKEKRENLLKILDTYHPPERFGRLTYKSGPITRLPQKMPILVMSARLDPYQKGFDILLRAVLKFAEDEVKVVLTPMPVKDSDLDYFREVAEKCSGNVTVFPIRMKEGYHELQLGSTFGIMPSIYEPFGAAIEYMVSGTVTIARKTGGLIDQVRHNECGFLYRERPQVYTTDNILSFAGTCDRVAHRTNNRWVEHMAEELYKTIKEATALYQNRPGDYYRMIKEGFKQARTFTWGKAAEKYSRVFEKVTAAR